MLSSGLRRRHCTAIEHSLVAIGKSSAHAYNEVERLKSAQYSLLRLYGIGGVKSNKPLSMKYVNSGSCEYFVGCLIMMHEREVEAEQRYKPSFNTFAYVRLAALDTFPIQRRNCAYLATTSQYSHRTSCLA